MIVKRSREEIDKVLRKAQELLDGGSSKWPGMSYEEGVDAALRWVLSETDDDPMDDTEC